jgi:hypothetical protein
MRTRTSVSHPLRIDTVPIPDGGGQIGMTLCPGRRDHLSVQGPWDRDLNADFDVIAAWKPNLMLTLVETPEFSLLGVPEFAEIAGRRVPKWRQLPLADASVPDKNFENVLEDSGRRSAGGAPQWPPGITALSRRSRPNGHDCRPTPGRAWRDARRSNRGRTSRPAADDRDARPGTARKFAVIDRWGTTLGPNVQGSRTRLGAWCGHRRCPRFSV